MYELGSLIFEPQKVKLLEPNQRICLRCRKIFQRKPGISDRLWRIGHKMCSIDCLGAMTDHKNGKRQPSGQNLFHCNVCGIEIIGKKQDLKKHKYDVHGH